MRNFSNSKIEDYVNGLTDLQQSLVLPIREAILLADEKIKEDIKWGSIAFFNQKNICGFRVAKNHVTLLFMEGALIKDQNKVLNGSGPKARTIKYTDSNQIDASIIQSLVQDALKLIP